MTRLSTLATAGAVAFVAATADAQTPPAQPAPDSAAEAGLRDGRAAAERRRVHDRMTLGLTTGFLAGLLAPTIVAEPLIGAASVVPVVWTLDAAGNPANLPPALAQPIQSQPPSYQQAFRIGYQERLAERRVRAARKSAVVGGVIGVATLTVFVVNLLKNAGG
jgi:hypothetical protein